MNEDNSNEVWENVPINDYLSSVWSLRTRLLWDRYLDYLVMQNLEDVSFVPRHNGI